MTSEEAAERHMVQFLEDCQDERFINWGSLVKFFTLFPSTFLLVIGVTSSRTVRRVLNSTMKRKIF